MDDFASYDGTRISYRMLGDGRPLVCLPGGPGRAASYLGNLGGLDATRQLVLVDPRGVGDSERPSDPSTLRADRLVEDVEALRAHLGLDRIDLLAHSAGAVLATLYAAAHPDRLSTLLLITPGLAALGLSGIDENLTATVTRSAAEPWYLEARAALEKILNGELSMDAFRDSRPLFYGRWDDTARAHATVGASEAYQAAREGYFADLRLDPSATKKALRALTAPVLLYAGERDLLATPAAVNSAAEAFNDPTVVVQPAAGHYPWIDDAAAFAVAVGSFLG